MPAQKPTTARHQPLSIEPSLAAPCVCTITMLYRRTLLSPSIFIIGSDVPGGGSRHPNGLPASSAQSMRYFEVGQFAMINLHRRQAKLTERLTAYILHCPLHLGVYVSPSGFLSLDFWHTSKKIVQHLNSCPRFFLRVLATYRFFPLTLGTSQ
ncbi:hypothetical protein KM043_013898 [Ampulex compressa]|nr:hypothetical protein KM043_013898 [Ampulex compressa]